MHYFRKITEDIYWVGGSDRRLSLFENLFPIPRGVSYNSYLLMDEKTVVFDTVDSAVSHQFMENITALLQGRSLDYLVLNHMEPDHCACISELIYRYPNMKLIGNARTFPILLQFHPGLPEERFVTVAEGKDFSTGKHTLQFVMAPMVHWPEVMMTYDKTAKVLYSADAFGTFGALGGAIFNDELDFDRDWLDDARRYYSNIVGKFGTQVQTALRKAAQLKIDYICPLHGPIWRSNLSYLIDKYQLWSTYEPEERGVLIAYGSMYGNTENAANVLAFKLADQGITNIRVHDVSVTDLSELISDTFKYSHLVLAAPSYNGGIYPMMNTYLDDMRALGVQNRHVAVIGNGSWGPVSAKLMESKLSEMKQMTLLTENFALKSTLASSQMGELDSIVEQIKNTL